MRNVSRGMLAILLAAGLSGVGGAANAAATRSDDDVLAKLKAIPGMTVEEKTSTLTGYRWFWLDYRQPIDHRNPKKGWFEQRILLEHKSDDRPMVLYTSGYNTPETMFLSEPTGLIDGNQISIEYRYFAPSIPEQAGLDEGQHLAGGHRRALDRPGPEDDLPRQVDLHRCEQGRHDRHVPQAVLPE